LNRRVDTTVVRVFWLVSLVFARADSLGSSASTEKYLEIRRYMGAGSYAESLEQCIQLLPEGTKSSDFYDLLVEASQYASRLQYVDSLLAKRVHTGQDVAGALYARARIRLRQGDWPAAIEMFERSLGYGYDSPAIYSGIELAYEQIHGVKEAVEHYLALTHREPQNPGVWYALALAYWSLPDPENSVSAIREALALSPSTRNFRQLLAGAMCTCVLNERTIKAAVKEVDDALKHNDVDGAEFVRWCLVDGLFAVGDWDRAF
jgi:tetratricopeptide (TPR) repeat protein